MVGKQTNCMLLSVWYDHWSLTSGHRKQITKNPVQKESWFFKIYNIMGDAGGLMGDLLVY